MFGDAIFIYIMLGAPLAWLAFRMLEADRRAPYAYAMLLYSTFLGHAATIGGTSVAIPLAAIVIFVEAINFVGARTRIASLKAIDVLAICLLLWWLISSAYHGSTQLSALRQPMVICIVLLASKFRPQFKREDFTVIMQGLVFGGAVVAIACILQDTVSRSLFGVVEIASKYERMTELRPTGLQGNPNAASLYLIFGFCAVLVRGFESWKKGEVFVFFAHTLVFLAIVWALYLGQSRSALLGLSVVFVLFLGRALDWQYSTTVVVAVGVGVVLLVFPDALFDLLNTIFSRREDPTELGREDLWNQAIEIMARSPIFGEPDTVFHYERGNFHNDFFAQAVKAGIPAGLIFMTMVLIPLLVTIRLRAFLRFPSFADMVFLLVLASIVHAMFHQVLQGGICFWMVVGLAVNSEYIRGAPSRDFRDRARRWKAKRNR